MKTRIQDALRDLLAAGMTETEIARGAGITQATVNKIKNGVHVDPRASTVFAILDLHKKLILQQSIAGG